MPSPPSGSVELVPGPSDYEAIEAAVMETARGRWFLAEYARRHRQADTAEVLAAIGRLEAGMAAERQERAAGAPSFAALAEAVARGRREIAALGVEDVPVGDRLAATAERLQELAWNLRETGSDEEACEAIEEGAAEIYAASRQAGQIARRATLACGVLDMLDERLGGAPERARTQPAAPPAALVPANDVLALDPEAPGPMSRTFGPDTAAVDWLEGEVLSPDASVEVLRSEPAGSPTPRPLRLPAVPTLQSLSMVRDETPAAVQRPRGPVTVGEIEALSYEDKVALFS